MHTFECFCGFSGEKHNETHTQQWWPAPAARPERRAVPAAADTRGRCPGPAVPTPAPALVSGPTSCLAFSPDALPVYLRFTLIVFLIWQWWPALPMRLGRPAVPAAPASPGRCPGLAARGLAPAQHLVSLGLAVPVVLQVDLRVYFHFLTATMHVVSLSRSLCQSSAHQLAIARAPPAAHSGASRRQSLPPARATRFWPARPATTRAPIPAVATVLARAMHHPQTRDRTGAGRPGALVAPAACGPTGARTPRSEIGPKKNRAVVTGSEALD